MGDRIYNVLFLCTGNSARSIMAEAVLNRLGGGKFKGHSAGSNPKGLLNMNALLLLDQLHYSLDGLRSKHWAEFSAAQNPAAPELDFVFTVCDNAAGEPCPVWPGQPITAHWGIPDPAMAKGSNAQIALAFADAYRQLYNRISVFVSLPLSSLDGIALKGKLDEIGLIQDGSD